MEKFGKWKIWVRLGCLCVFLCLVVPRVAFPATSKLPTQTVKQLYKDGEFENLKGLLENFLKRSDSTASLEERILAYKYLGVVYASSPAGAPQAEAYFFRLLDLSPKVELTELYVSSTVNKVFQNTRERFQTEKRISNSVDEFGFPIQDKQVSGETMGESEGGSQGDAMAHLMQGRPTQDSTLTRKPVVRNGAQHQTAVEKKSHAIWPWVLGAACIGGGVGAYYLTTQTSDTKKEIIAADAR